MNENNLKCNICVTGEMEYKEHKGTRIYICDQCPNVQIEYYNNEDIKNLLESFGS